jgi:hypothetical protein
VETGFISVDDINLSGKLARRRGVSTEETGLAAEDPVEAPDVQGDAAGQGELAPACGMEGVDAGLEVALPVFLALDAGHHGQGGKNPVRQATGGAPNIGWREGSAGTAAGRHAGIVADGRRSSKGVVALRRRRDPHNGPAINLAYD